MAALGGFIGVLARVEPGPLPAMVSTVARSPDTSPRVFIKPLASQPAGPVKATVNVTASLPLPISVRAFVSLLANTPPLTKGSIGTKADAKKPCKPYRQWEREWFPDTDAEMCPLLIEGVDNMAFNIAPGTTRVLEWLVQAGANDQMILNRGFLRVDNSSAVNLSSSEILANLREDWRLTFLKDLDATYRVRNYIVRQLKRSIATASGFRFEYDKQALLEGVPASDTGTKVGDPLPLFAAMTIQLKSDEVGRSRKGSKRFAPLVEDDSEPGYANFWKADVQTTWQNNAAGFFNPVAYPEPLQSATHVIASAKLLDGGDAQDPALLPIWTAAITTVYANLRIGSQNSRKTKAELF